MNQSQRMAPVGTDKELRDLLDFSMVSQTPILPEIMSRFLGQGSTYHNHSEPGSTELLACLDGKSPRWNFPPSPTG
jgi:hypothetical protein